MHTPSLGRGFTLIELLVVITIIVVLLSLLTPALDKAIYRAELVSCAARLKGIATALLTYASSSKRTYPVYDPYGAGVQPDNIRGPVGGGGPGNSDPFDYRPTARGYMALKAFQCPLAGNVDLDNNDSQWMWTSYDMRAGFAFKGYKGMMRMGDRWDFADTFSDPNKPRSYSFDIIVSDEDTRTDKQRTTCAHPDYGDDATSVIGQEFDQLYFFRLWKTGKDGVMRGPTDLNFAYQDGSAGTLFAVKPPPPKGDDERMARIACWADESSYSDGYFRQVPKP